uniref:Uncharacterized protein n=1 Tax=Physcomitrium patens TaxID=3218 RepID=A0A2K1IMW3_PHYPA|nr:hypothetical protein PHYPA_026926 [Physcomitrium patens]
MNLSAELWQNITPMSMQGGFFLLQWAYWVLHCCRVFRFVTDIELLHEEWICGGGKLLYMEAMNLSL